MKKEYVKPFLAIESFQLDAAIAGSCGDAGKMILGQAIDHCTLGDDGNGDPDYGGDIYFGAACDADITVDDICYQAMAYSGAYLVS